MRRRETYSRSILKGLSGLALLAGAPGCGPTDAGLEETGTCIDLAAPMTASALSLGSAETGTFRAFLPGESLRMEHGPQGGQHVYFSMRVFGSTPGDALDAVMKTAAAVAGRAQPLTLSEGEHLCAPHQWLEIQNRRLFLDVPNEMTGVLVATLTRGGALLVSAETPLLVTP